MTRNPLILIARALDQLAFRIASRLEYERAFRAHRTNRAFAPAINRPGGPLHPRVTGNPRDRRSLTRE